MFVSHEKANEYLMKISKSIQQHGDFWQNRRASIADEMRSLSVDLLLPKAQRMNELIIDAVQSKNKNSHFFFRTKQTIDSL